ncbi:unnamed protein product [Symbiodinium sp. CCMP2456]|nr:unnamed protein product [Symbiodinium sp. CCMP2456]
MAFAAGQDRNVLFIVDLPKGVSADKMDRLHMAHGLAKPINYQFVQRNANANKEVSCALFTYLSSADAESALEVLIDLPVEHNGRYWPLRVEIAGPRALQEVSVLLHATAPAMMNQQPQQDSAVILLGQVPAEWTAEDLKVFHDSLDIERLVGVKILPSTDGGWTCRAILQYMNPNAAAQALDSLMGRVVLTRSGARRHLTANLADPSTSVEPVPMLPKPPLASPPSAPSKSRNKAHVRQEDQTAPVPQPMAQHDPFTLYVADVPADFGKQDLDKLHAHLGLQKPKVTKLLYPRMSNDKCSAILRYSTQQEAFAALGMFHDRLVLVNEHSGEQQHPRAQYAKKRSSAYPSEDQPLPQEPDSESGEDKDDRLYALPSVYLAELPINITENGVRHILHEVDAHVAELVAVNFLQQKSKGTHRCCLLRYPDLPMAEDVAQRVNGFMVYHPDDRTRPVRAKVAKHARMFNQHCTDVYVGEVPFDWNASAVYKLLAEAGIERGAVHSVKLLSHRPGRTSVGVILRVVDADVAEDVMGRLNGLEVNIRGQMRALKARLADPPPWPEAPETRKPMPKPQNRRPRDQFQLQ